MLRTSSKLHSVKGLRQGLGSETAMARYRTGMRGISLLFVLSAFCCILFASCVARKAELPSFEGVDPKEVLAQRENIRSIEATIYIEFEKDGSVMKGDGVLRLTQESLDLQIYSLGFLVAEVTSNGTVARSDPPIEKGRLFMLIEGLKSSFFWWSVKNPEIRDYHGSYRVSNSWRRLILDKKTMMPEKQTIDLEDGRQLTTYYEDPALMDGIWFPSSMRMELSGHSVSLKVKTLSVNQRAADNRTL